MFENLPFFPVQASEQAAQVDALYFFLVAVSAFFALLIAVLILVFAFKYHRKHPDEVGEAIHGSIPLELLWTFIPLGITMVMFFWGAAVFFHMTRPPTGAMEIYVVGKQWMWKMQHMEGQREINELHIPLGRPVKLIMTSEDVIHSFYVPAFRTKQDVLPGRYTTEWFKPSKPGRYHIFCAEYCGTKHSGMIGWIDVMEPSDYQAWVSGGRAMGSMAENGEKLFRDLACINCHHLNDQGRCPNLVGIFGQPVQLSTNEKVKVDEGYIRESILNPNAKVVAGFQPIMPTFQGLVTEEGLLQLVEYIKSLGQRPGQVPIGATPAAPPASSRPATR